MYLFGIVVAIITGFISLVDILFDLDQFGSVTKLLVKISSLLFWASLLYLVIRNGKRK
ncbi:hypothetical protein SAMN04488601_104139 [Paenibacillus sp. 453mf]|nr:hypothetical protein SAMN04488601_104139 [Paenibacillus sp. 453mf]